MIIASAICATELIFCVGGGSCHQEFLIATRVVPPFPVFETYALHYLLMFLPRLFEQELPTSS